MILINVQKIEKEINFVYLSRSYMNYMNMYMLLPNKLWIE